MKFTWITIKIILKLSLFYGLPWYSKKIEGHVSLEHYFVE